MERCKELLQRIAELLGVPSATLAIYTAKEDKPIIWSFSGNANIANASTSTSLFPTLPSSAQVSSKDAAEPTKEMENEQKSGQMLYMTASLAKHFVLMIFCILIETGYSNESGKMLSWQTKAYKLLNQLRFANGKDPVPEPKIDPTVEQLFLHESFPALINFLLSPRGRVLVSEEDFLEYSANLARWVTKKESPEEFEYSNCNFIVLVCLLKEFLNLTMVEILDQYIVQRFSLTGTTIEKNVVRDLKKKGMVHKGYRQSADLTKIEEVGELQYMDSEMESMAFGCRSCVSDFAKLYVATLKANAGEEGQPINKKIAQAFFAHRNTEEVSRSPFGLRGPLSSAMPGIDSLNQLSRPSGQKRSFTLGTDQGREVFVQYKGATVNGFTGSVYIVPKNTICVVAMANVTGPLEFTDYACQIVLEHIYSLQPPVDDIFGKLEKDLKIAMGHIGKMEQQDERIPDLTYDIREWVGKYKHTICHQTIEITRNGKFIKTGSHFADGEPRRDEVEARIVQSNLLRIFPGQGLLALDRRSAHFDVTFRKGSPGEPGLKGRHDFFEKIS